VPPSLLAFLQATDFEDSVRNAVSLGGDADTMACIAGAVAHAFHGGIPQRIADVALAGWMIACADVVQKFSARFGVR